MQCLLFEAALDETEIIKTLSNFDSVHTHSCTISDEHECSDADPQMVCLHIN